MDPLELANVVRRLCPSVDLSEQSLAASGQLLKDTLRTVIKNARTLARHRKRVEVNSDDINHALEMSGYEARAQFVDQRFTSLDGKDIFFAESVDISAAEVNNVVLEVPPVDLQIHSHWLAVDGTQPRVPENEPVPTARSLRTKSQRPSTSKDAPSRKRKNHVETVQSVSGGMVQGGIELRLPVEHALTTEQQAYFDQIKDCLQPIAQDPTAASELDTDALEKAEKKIHDLENDAALQPLVPYLIRCSARHVYLSTSDAGIMKLTLQLLRSLVRNKHLDLELYSHFILPLILSCLLSENIGDGSVHRLGVACKVRDEAALVLANAVHAFDDVVNNIQARISQRLADSLAKDTPNIVKYGPLNPHPLREWLARWIEGIQKLMKLSLHDIEEQSSQQDSTGLIYQQGRICAALIEEIMGRLQNDPGSDSIPVSTPLARKARTEDAFI